MLSAAIIQSTEPGMADAMGPIVFVVVVFGGLGSLAGCFIASIIMGMVQTFAVVIDDSVSDLLRPPASYRRRYAAGRDPDACRWRGSARCCRSS